MYACVSASAGSGLASIGVSFRCTCTETVAFCSLSSQGNKFQAQLFARGDTAARQPAEVPTETSPPLPLACPPARYRRNQVPRPHHTHYSPAHTTHQNRNSPSPSAEIRTYRCVGEASHVPAHSSRNPPGNSRSGGSWEKRAYHIPLIEPIKGRYQGDRTPLCPWLKEKKRLKTTPGSPCLTRPGGVSRDRRLRHRHVTPWPRRTPGSAPLLTRRWALSRSSSAWGGASQSRGGVTATPPLIDALGGGRAAISQGTFAPGTGRASLRD